MPMKVGMTTGRVDFPSKLVLSVTQPREDCVCFEGWRHSKKQSCQKRGALYPFITSKRRSASFLRTYFFPNKAAKDWIQSLNFPSDFRHLAFYGKHTNMPSQFASDCIMNLQDFLATLALSAKHIFPQRTHCPF